MSNKQNCISLRIKIGVCLGTLEVFFAHMNPFTNYARTVIGLREGHIKSCKKPKHCFLLSVDCSWTNWGPWGSCSKTCGSGTMTRSRSKNGPILGGSECSGSSSSSTSCNTNSCPGEEKISKTYIHSGGAPSGHFSSRKSQEVHFSEICSKAQECQSGTKLGRRNPG